MVFHLLTSLKQQLYIAPSSDSRCYHSEVVVRPALCSNLTTFVSTKTHECPHQSPPAGSLPSAPSLPQVTVQVGAECMLHRVPMLSERCTVHSAQCMVNSEQCTVHSAQCIVYSVQCTVHSTQYAAHNTQCTVHSPRYTVHSAQCKVYSA